MTAYIVTSAVFSTVALTWAFDPSRRRAVARRTAQRREGGKP